MSTGEPHRRQPHRTLWEEGRHPGRLVAAAAGLLVLAVVTVDVFTFGRLTLLFDVAFVATCVAAALAVRPREFFVIGVFPPLLMAATVALLALVNTGAVADVTDGFLQALVSGLAHHSGALVIGYGLTLVVLAIRQVAIRNAGLLLASAGPRIPEQRRPQAPAATDL